MVRGYQGDRLSGQPAAGHEELQTVQGKLLRRRSKERNSRRSRVHEIHSARPSLERLVGKFQKYVAHKLQAFTDDVKLEDTKDTNKHVDKLAKVLALNMACKYGVKKCEEYAEKIFNEWLDNKNT